MRKGLRNPKSALESDPYFGWFLICALSVLLIAPFAAIASIFAAIFNETVAAIAWIAMCIGFPTWAIWLGRKPF